MVNENFSVLMLDACFLGGEWEVTCNPSISFANCITNALMLAVQIFVPKRGLVSDVITALKILEHGTVQNSVVSSYESKNAIHRPHGHSKLGRPSRKAISKLQLRLV